MNLTSMQLDPVSLSADERDHRRLLLAVSGAILFAGAIGLAVMAAVGNGGYGSAHSWATHAAPASPAVPKPVVAPPPPVVAPLPPAVPVGAAPRAAVAAPAREVAVKPAAVARPPQPAARAKPRPKARRFEL